MKHTKMFLALIVLAAAVLAFGCNHANTPSQSNTTTNDGGAGGNAGGGGGSSGGNAGGGGGSSGGGLSGGFTMNAQQQAAYNAAITSVKQQTAAQTLTAQVVAQQLQAMNAGFAPLNFKVVDTQAGQPIAQGTTEDALKARFKPEAL